MIPPTNIRSAITPKEDAEKLIRGYATRIIKCIQAGWEVRRKMQEVLPNDFPKLRSGSIANVVYDWVADALEHEFKDDAPDVRVLRKHKSVRLVIKDILNTRFNKANTKGQVSRNKTLVQSRFNTQQFEEQSVLTNFPYPTNINITWQLNATGTEIDVISVRCPIKGNEVAWEFVIKSPSEAEKPAQFSTTNEPTGKKSRVKSRTPRTQETQEPEAK